MKIISVVGARPNFIKIAPFIREIDRYNQGASDPIEHLLVHTGQHYDDRMSKRFFEALNIPAADINLDVGSGSHAYQVGTTMIEFEKILIKERPDWVVVVGDVNATLACSVTAKKEHIIVCHIEAGLRSGDLDMPEEINRLITDRISDLLLTPDRISTNNLYKEGVDAGKIELVGNIMIDTLEANKAKSEILLLEEIVQRNLLDEQKHTEPSAPDVYALVTLHRPSNVDDKDILSEILDFLLNEVSKKMSIVWPVHPRTKSKLMEFGCWDHLVKSPDCILLHPLGYHEMLKLNISSKIVLTDSGGLQEECTVLGTPCLTLRWNTERPVTLTRNGGVSQLVGNDVEKIRAAFFEMLLSHRMPHLPELWDGMTAQRCLKSITSYLEASDLDAAALKVS